MVITFFLSRKDLTLFNIFVLLFFVSLLHKIKDNIMRILLDTFQTFFYSFVLILICVLGCIYITDSKNNNNNNDKHKTT